MFTGPSVNPFLPIPIEHDIVRVNRKKEWILLENDGILEIGVRFNISDRKQLGINNKVRQLSFGYKMVTNNFRQVVNDYIDNGFRTPIGPPLFAAVKGIAQTYSGLYNSVPLKVRITHEEFGLNFSQGNDGISNTNN